MKNLCDMLTNSLSLQRVEDVFKKLPLVEIIYVEVSAFAVIESFNIFFYTAEYLFSEQSGFIFGSSASLITLGSTIYFHSPIREFINSIGFVTENDYYELVGDIEEGY